MLKQSGRQTNSHTIVSFSATRVQLFLRSLNYYVTIFMQLGNATDAFIANTI